MKIVTTNFAGASFYQEPGCAAPVSARLPAKNDYVCVLVAQRVEALVARAGQITGTDLAAELGITIERLRVYTRHLVAHGRVHKMRGRKYPAGLWMPGPERAGEHEPGETPVHLRVKHWQRAAVRIDLAEALLFNRFPALTAQLLADGAGPVKVIHLAKAQQQRTGVL